MSLLIIIGINTVADNHASYQITSTEITIVLFAAPAVCVPTILYCFVRDYGRNRTGNKNGILRIETHREI